MRKVITYGTFDLLHEGHINLLKRAKTLGDYLVVGVTSDSFDRERGKLNVRDNTLARVDAVRKTGLADEIIIEEYVGQKIDDIQRMEVDVFAIGSDWEGKFDYLQEFCEVNYLPRTEGISSTMLRSRDSRTLRLGIVGTGRIARRFIPEISYVTGVKSTAVFNPQIVECRRFAEEFDLNPVQSFSQLLGSTDAIYIASPHLSHYCYAKEALLAGKHVMCEIPMTLSLSEAKELYNIAKEKELVLLEASKTAHSPAFNHIVSLVKSGVIGDVVDIRASLSKLTVGNVRELDSLQAGGCMTELSHFPLLSIVKLLGTGYTDLNFHSKICNGVDVFTKGVINYPSAVSTITLGLGVKTEGNLVVSGTKGYIYVPAPWWRTDFFEIRYENQTLNKKYFYPYEGEGLRYELKEFVSMIFKRRLSTYRLRENEALCIIGIIEHYRRGNYTILK